MPTRHRPRHRITSRHVPLLLAAATLAVLSGCQAVQWPGWLTRFQSPSGSGRRGGPAKRPSEVGDYVSFGGLSMITLEGVGLVTGLDNTGGDPPPSSYRLSLIKDMRRRQVRNPKSLLRSRKTAMVVVRAYLPPLIRKGERFDVEVRLPEGSEATSLNGGWLMQTDLSERAIVPGQGVLSGHIFARAEGNILISHGEGDQAELAGILRRGRVLGGGVSRRDRDLQISLRSRYRSVRMARRIGDRIGRRFYSYNRHSVREPLAVPKTNRMISLKIHPRYRDNYPRYLQVIRKIATTENQVSRQIRMQQLTHVLKTPETAETAAWTLEAIGPAAIPFLKTALDDNNLEVRFHAAASLAYLDDNAGARVLADAARNQRAFRVYALAALATLDDAHSQLLLRELLSPVHVCGTAGCLNLHQTIPAHHADDPAATTAANTTSRRNRTAAPVCPHCGVSGVLRQSAELQYGAFRALWTRDRFDPAIRGEKLGDVFTLHQVDAVGAPLIHLTQLQRAELVLFGQNQRLRTPLAVQAGNHIWLNAQPGSPSITISRYELGKKPRREIVSTRVADVIRTLVEFGASYPDVVGMLVQAERQRNVAGLIAIDAMPRTGRIYFRPGPEGGRSTKTRFGSNRLSPNLFPKATPPGTATDQAEVTETDAEEGEGEGNREAVAGASEGSGTASLADRRTPAVSQPDPAADPAAESAAESAAEPAAKTAADAGDSSSGTSGPLDFLKSLFR